MTISVTQNVTSALAKSDGGLTDDEILGALISGLESIVAGEQVLVLIPDLTRRLPVERLLAQLGQALHRARGVRVMVALGTHPPLPESDLARLSGYVGELEAVPVANHTWQDDAALVNLGSISAGRLREVAGEQWHPSVGGPLTVRINRAAVEADRVLIVGPTLPHEVAGYSGGAKYLFPGISGPEMIDTMHWVGALSGVMGTIGFARTPVRELIAEAASLLPTPVSLVAAVTDADGSEQGLAGLFVGGLDAAWAPSVALAEQLHTVWLDAPFQRIISRPLPIYGELWTAAKAVYKLEGAVADGGELIVHAPALDTVSRTHGEGIFGVGYHVMPYFLGQWARFEGVPLAVLAHSTHVKGAGSFEDGRERPRITVRLATAISPSDCARLNLGYTDPRSPDIGLAGGVHDGGRTLVVPDAGEVLYRIREVADHPSPGL